MAAWGHFDPFPPPRLNGRHPFSYPTSARASANGKDAPISGHSLEPLGPPAVRGSIIAAARLRSCSRFSDLVGAVAVGSLHRVDDKVLPHPEVRVDVFPDDLACGRDLEKSPEPAF